MYSHKDFYLTRAQNTVCEPVSGSTSVDRSAREVAGEAMRAGVTAKDVIGALKAAARQWRVAANAAKSLGASAQVFRSQAEDQAAALESAIQRASQVQGVGGLPIILLLGTSILGVGAFAFSSDVRRSIDRIATPGDVLREEAKVQATAQIIQLAREGNLTPAQIQKLVEAMYSNTPDIPWSLIAWALGLTVAGIFIFKIAGALADNTVRKMRKGQG